MVPKELNHTQEQKKIAIPKNLNHDAFLVCVKSFILKLRLVQIFGNNSKLHISLTPMNSLSVHIPVQLLHECERINKFKELKFLVL